MSAIRAERSLPIEEKDPDFKANGFTCDDPDVEFGGKEARTTLERKLLWKLDLRMSILVVIYILNYVNSPITFSFESRTNVEGRSTETMLGMCTTPPRLNKFSIM